MNNLKSSNIKFKKLIRRNFSLLIAGVFLINTLFSGLVFAQTIVSQGLTFTLAPLAASQSSKVKQSLMASMLRASREIIIADTDPRYLAILNRYRAPAVLLDPGVYIMTQETADNDLALVGACAHEDVKILMQDEEKRHPMRYDRVMQQVLGNEAIIDLYYRISNYEDVRKHIKKKHERQRRIIFNDIIAKAFEYLFLIDEGLAYPGELDSNKRAFLDLMRPILEAKDSLGRYKNFSKIFFEVDRRTKVIQRLQEDKDEKFYRGASIEAGAVLTPKVFGEAVGIFRLIPDIVTNYHALWELKDNEIVGVGFYPTADSTSSRPMAIVTSEEMAGLSHAEVRARYWRIPHVQIQDLNALKEFDGKWIYIKAAEAGVELRLATKEEIANYELYKPRTPTPKLEEVSLTAKANILDWTQATDPKEVSHKFSSLHTVFDVFWKRRGHPSFCIHFGSVIPYATYKRVLDANPGVEENIRSLVASINNDDIDDIKRRLFQIRKVIISLNIPDDIWGDAKKVDWREGAQSIDYTVRNETYDGNGVFVRTGTNAEDLPDYPGFGAGQYGTFPNVLRKDVRTAVKMAWASIWSEGAYIDRMKVGVDHFAVYPAVQITKAIDAKYAFVVHTADPNGQDKDKVYIEIVQGLGEGLVGDKYPGEAHRYVYSKSQDKIIRFDVATKQEKAVLNPEGGLSRAQTDYSNDIFARDGIKSPIALAIARQSVAIEKAAGRPQDIEGANDSKQEHVWMLTQSRSEVGYDRALMSWEEYFNANRERALAFMEKHKAVLFGRVPSYSFVSDVQKMLRHEISTSPNEGLICDEAANILRLFYSFGDEGREFAGRIFMCGAGVHKEFQGALEKLPFQIRAGIIAHAAIDYEMLDKEALGDFESMSNYNLAKVIMVHDSAAWRDIFKQVPPRDLAFLIAEVVAFYHKPKVGWEQAAIRDFSLAEFYKVVGELYGQYDSNQQREFSGYLSRKAAMNIEGLSKEEPQYELSSEDRKNLLRFRYYKKPHGIVLSASSIDGCLGLSSFFFSLRSSLKRDKEGQDPFHFFILMDIPNERPEDFLRRNSLVGRHFTAVLMPSKIKAEHILRDINDLINRNPSYSVLVKGDSIVFIGPGEFINQYATEENEVLVLPVSPQGGRIPLVIADAIRLLTKIDQDKEEALSAWLTSRGLDGAKRYREWVYDAERYLEAYEKAEAAKVNHEVQNRDIYAPFADRLLKYIAARDPSSDDLNKLIDYMLNKNAAVTSDIIFNAFAVLWPKHKDKVKDAQRALGFKAMRQIGTNLPTDRETETQHMKAAREFLEKNLLFPRSAEELENLLAGMEAAEAISLLVDLHKHFVVDDVQDTEFPRGVAEPAVAAGFCRNYCMTSIKNRLPTMFTEHPGLLQWLSSLIAAHGPGYEIVTENEVKHHGSKTLYIMREKLSGRSLKSAARRERMARGEAINPAALLDEDFEEWAVEMAIKINYEFYCHDITIEPDNRQARNLESFLFFVCNVGDEYAELHLVQDLIEYMYRDDNGYAIKTKIIDRGGQPLASVVLCLCAVLELGVERALLIFEAAPPKLVADMVHYALQSRTNEGLRAYYMFNNHPEMSTILRGLINGQIDVRKAAIEHELSPQAKEFLTPAPTTATPSDRLDAGAVKQAFDALSSEA
jgi:hypothetical protein